VDEAYIVMQESLKGNVVFVTGSARRVGRAIALGFARAGANIVIHHHSSSSVEAAKSAVAEAKDCGVEALIVQGDQSKPDDVASIFEAIEAHYGKLDVMVNSAANFMKTPLLEISFEEWQEVLGVNLTGPFLCTQHAARLMLKGGSGGTIINISDVGGLRAWKTRPHHSVAKAGVIMLTKASAKALGEDNIRVNAIVPGPILPAAGDDDANFEAMGKKLPLKRTGDPTDIANACIFLATNRFITGTILTVDGGESIT
jgi:NAD(P)-dependent dehydrogenase (short-subunit alcohol dehydrogenase family)